MYVPKPIRDDRRALFIKFTGPKNSLSDDDWDILADSTDGWSTSDIKTHIINAKSHLELTIYKAKFFKPIITPEGPTWAACLESRDGAIEMSALDLDMRMIYRPIIEYSDICVNMSMQRRNKEARRFIQPLRWLIDIFRSSGFLGQQRNMTDRPHSSAASKTDLHRKSKADKGMRARFQRHRLSEAERRKLSGDDSDDDYSEERYLDYMKKVKKNK